MIALAFALLGASAAWCCGPFFPNTLLDQGDAAVLSAPQACFETEIQRMKLIAPTFVAKPATNAPLESMEVDLADLQSALEKMKAPGPEQQGMIARYQQEREKIQMGARESLRATNSVRIPGEVPQVALGLPEEFVDYFRGAIAWHLDKLPDARSAWMSLLLLPASQRHFKSTWAAFMIGRSWEEQDPDRAISYFRAVRSLVKAGFADSLGLAESSLGFEARLFLRKKRFVEAIDLYLEQAASGDPSAILSLRFTSARAMAEGSSALRPLARHPRAQRVITAYVIAGGYGDRPIDTDNILKESTLRMLEKASTKTTLIAAPAPGSHTFRKPAVLWLEAVEAAHVRDLDSAEKIALVAYQAGDMELARRWLDRCSNTPISQWLQAKLLLREGKVAAAAALLAQVSKAFPVVPRGTNSLAERLYIEPGGSEYEYRISVARQVQGELGVLHLARRQYAEALDALLWSGYWEDAAYVAERVLTLDELKNFVDAHSPDEWQPRKRVERDEKPEAARANADEMDAEAQTVGEKLRYLLARRLTRAQKRMEARSYYPTNLSVPFDKLCAALEQAQRNDLAGANRAAAYFEAAKILRTSGLELVGTELDPDWAIWGGSFAVGTTVSHRAALGTNALSATEDEIKRGESHVPTPDLRWHYRYAAANLAWEAARLMPDNSDETARTLCTGGSWIKYLDPEKADVFYKALVRRCRKTAIGTEADRIRWFPLLNESGDLLPRAKQPLSPGERAAKKPQEPAPG